MTILLSGFSVAEKIFESPNSVAYRALREHDQLPVVLKTPKSHIPPPAERIRYRREYDILHHLDLEDVVRAYGLLPSKNSLVLILEDFGGTSLQQIMNQRPLVLEEILNIGRAVSHALGKIHHQQIIHKDICPANVVWNEKTQTIKLIDFSSATRFTRQTPTLKNPNKLEGTLAYMAPEQTGRMNRALDYRVDFYAFGVMLYEMLASQLPFSTEDPLEMIYSHMAQEPPRLHELYSHIPEVVSDIVQKLMAKTAEQRYQSAWGIEADLEACLTQFRTQGHIDTFPLAQADFSERFEIPQILYGRQQEAEHLLAAFEQVSAGQTALMVVTGQSGIGKSSLVREISKPITRQRGFFISGHFDPYLNDVPYSAIVGAFQDLVRQLLTENPPTLQQWKTKLLDAVGINGQLVIELIPEVELIIGPQPPVQAVAPVQATNRFHHTFQRFIQVFAGPDHPLVIFLDDLQWADLASLNLLKAIHSDEAITHLFIIGAYRDNEVVPTHQLAVALEDWKRNGVSIDEMVLAPMKLPHTTQLIADTFHQAPNEVLSLAQLVQNKTEGNPFFVIQFLTNLYEQELVNFVIEKREWTWDIHDIRGKQMATNVVDLVADKLKKLPKETQQVLRLAACLGHHFDTKLLSLVSQHSLTKTYQMLLPALESGLLSPISDFEITETPDPEGMLVIRNMKFLHDRVRQAAYSLVTQEEKPSLHLQIGQLLLSELPQDEQTDRLFEIVDHFNHGRTLLSLPQEKVHLAQLNLTAGIRAKEAIAFSSARQYLESGIEHLPETMWQDHHELAFALNQALAETEYVLGNWEHAEQLTTELLSHAITPIQQAGIYRMILRQQMAQGQYTEAIAIGRLGLELVDVDLPTKDYTTASTNLYQQVNQLIGNGDLVSLLDEPEMEDGKETIALQILSHLVPPAYMANHPLWKPLILTGVDLSLRLGNRAESAPFYAWFASLLMNQFHEYSRGREAAQLALECAEKFPDLQNRCRTKFYLASNVHHWMGPMQENNLLLDEAIQAGLSSGEFLNAGYAIGFKIPLALYSGKRLHHILEEIPKLKDWAEKIKNTLSSKIIQSGQAVLGKLVGSEEVRPSTVEPFHEADFIQVCAKQGFPASLCTYYTLKAQVSFILGSPVDALWYIQAATDLGRHVKGQATEGLLNFYSSLIWVEALPQSSPSQQEAYRKLIETNQKQMQIWSENCPENWMHKYQLVEAEIARLKQEGYDAIEQYNQAIALARQHAFIQEEAIGNELLARFWLQKEKEEIAQVFLQNAHHLYKFWGANAKTQQMKATYGEVLKVSHPSSAGTGPLGIPTRISPVISARTSAAILDLETVLQAYRAISGEIHLDQLIKKLLAFVLKEAGAQRGVLILEKDGQLVVEAEGQEASEHHTVLPSIPLNQYPHVWEGLIQYVARTWEKVTLSNATYQGPYINDPYVIIHQPKSVLCTPIVHHGQFMGIVYLENNLTPAAFTQERVELLEAISAQAAISMQNAILYHNLSNEIAERKQVEAALRSSEERYRVLNEALEERVKERTAEVTHAFQQIQRNRDDMMAILNQLQIGTINTDTNGTVTFVSDAAQQLLGKSLMKACGRHWAEVFLVSEHVKSQIEKVIETPASRRLKISIEFQTGEASPPLRVEVDIQDDPRDPQQKIFYLYDTTEVHDLRQRLEQSGQEKVLVGNSSAMDLVFKQIQELGRVDSTVLIQGETGAGKELVARAIHDASHRKDQPFIPVNCAGLTDSLITSQLFGHRKGAFTGAIADQQGVFEAADGGTLFLDEIGDIPASVQTSLLRVLEERAITRVGETKLRKIDVRVIAATHRNLTEEVEAGRFRTDLLFRIRVARIFLPPLRERTDDIPLLVQNTLRHSQALLGHSVTAISSEALKLLYRYSWPGNVREFNNAIESAVISAKSPIIQPHDLPPEILHGPADTKETLSSQPLDEKSHLLAVLEKTGGNRQAAARLLGVSRSTLYRRLERYNIPTDS